MKLLNIYVANAVWLKLSQAILPPTMAYSLMKYSRLMDVEYSVVDQARVALIREITKTKDGEEASIEVGTDAHKEYIERFGSMLAVDSDLAPCELKFSDVLQCLENTAQCFTIQEVGAIEPFFTV